MSLTEQWSPGPRKRLIRQTFIARSRLTSSKEARGVHLHFLCTSSILHNHQMTIKLTLMLALTWILLHWFLEKNCYHALLCMLCSIQNNADQQFWTNTPMSMIWILPTVSVLSYVLTTRLEKRLFVQKKGYYKGIEPIGSHTGPNCAKERKIFTNKN